MWLLWWGRRIWLSPLFSLLPHFLLFLWSPCFSLISLPFKSWPLIFYIHQTPAALLPSLHRMSLWKKKSLAQPKVSRTPSNRCVSSSGLPTWCPWWSLWVCSPVSLADHGNSFLSRLGVLDFSVHSKVPLPHAPVHTPACSFGLEWDSLRSMSGFFPWWEQIWQQSLGLPKAGVSGITGIFPPSVLVFSFYSYKNWF